MEGENEMPLAILSYKVGKYAEGANTKGITRLNILPAAILSFIYPGLVTFIVVYYGAGGSKYSIEMVHKQ